MPSRETVRFSLTFLVWACTLGGCSDALDPPGNGGAGSGGTAFAGAAGASAGGTAGTAAGAGGTAGSGNATGAGGSGTGGAVATGGTGGAGAAGGVGTGGSAAGTAGTGGAAVGGSAGAVAGEAGAGGTGAVGGSGAGGATGGGGAGGDATGGTAAGEGGTAGAGASGAGGNAGTAGTAGTSSDPPEPGVVGEPIGFASENGGTTGGRGGQVVTARTFAELAQYASASGPYVILIEGTISNGSGGGRVSVSSNKSLVGLGSTAFLQGVGLEIKNSNNVIVQNLKITLVGTTTPTSVNGGDAIVINGTSKNVWIDHCELYAEDPTVQTNIDKYDGLIDIRDQTGFITVSWSYLHDHHKACLVGASDEDLHDDRKVTYHHNYFRKIVKRMPMYRGSIGHFFNNYVVGVSTTEATFMVMGTCVRVEKNVYETVKYAIYSATDGTRGSAQRIDNIGSQSRAWPADCTANIPYDYSDVLIENTNDVKTLVPAGAGVGKL